MPSVNSIRIADMSKKDEILHKLATEYKISISNLTNHNVNLDHGSITNSQLFKDGLITIQDSAASLVVDAFNFKGDEKVLDACSAPGGKTAQIAEYLTTGKVFALDIHQKKLNLVKQTLTRLHQDQKLIMKALDARKVNEYFFGQQFDKILVDAPCSGLGLIRRKPEVRYEKQMEDLKHLSEIQYNILDHVAGLLAENGELVYSTCTISIEENEDVVKRFLTNHPDFFLAPFEVGNLSKCKMIKIFPDDYNSDGFFIAKFVKRG
jgi:16S rRNA (cytosine967-C5)-methyltransferase